MWWFLLYCVALVGFYWLGSVQLSLHWFWAFVSAATGAGAVVLTAFNAASSWRIGSRTFRELPGNVTCLDARAGSALWNAAVGAQAPMTIEEIVGLRFGLWYLLILPGAVLAKTLLSSLWLSLGAAVLGALIVAWLLRGFSTWREKRAVSAARTALAGAQGAHKWEGCKCRVCNGVRSEGHDWEGCKCQLCGLTRDQGHDWDRCKCRACDKRRSEGHVWEHCKCTICGASRDEGHQWEGQFCTVCGKRRGTSEVLETAALCEAAENGEFSAVQRLLDKRVDPNVANEDGWYAIELAARNPEVVTLLLASGADASAARLDRYVEYPNTLEIMLTHGASLNTRRREWGLPLHVAVRHFAKTDPQKVRFLLDHGADPNLTDSDGKTPLHVVFDEPCKEHALETLQVLFDAGANLGIRDKDGYTPADYAIRKSPVSLHGTKGENEDLSEEQSHLRTVQFLIKHDAPFDKQALAAGAPTHNADVMEKPFIFSVLEYGSGELLELLLQKGLDVNQQPVYVDPYNGERWVGITPLHWAVVAAPVERTALLLAHGARPNVELPRFPYRSNLIRDFSGQTPLHLAYNLAHDDPDRIEVMELLLAHGADIGASGIEGMTLLHDAAEQNDIQFVEFLLARGADSQARDKMGKTPLAHAIEMNNQGVVKALTQHAQTSGFGACSRDGHLWRDDYTCQRCGIAQEDVEPQLPLPDALRAARGGQLHKSQVHRALRVITNHEESIAASVDPRSDNIRYYSELMLELARFRDASCVPTIAHVMLEGYPSLKAPAAKALGIIGSRDAVPHLLQAVEEYDSMGFVKEAVFEALVQIGDPRARDAIFSVLPRLGSSLTREAAFALGSLGDRRAIPLLKEIMRNETVIGDKARAKDLIRRLGS